MPSEHSATKNESFERIKAQLGEKQRIVLTAILLHHPITRAELAKHTGLRLSSVCGRVNELIKKGYVIVQGVKHDDQTDRNVDLLIPNPFPIQIEIFAALTPRKRFL